MQTNYYLILGLSNNATLDEIKAAFRRRARELHPDRSGLGSGPFLEIQEAYAVLSDPERRDRYDRQLKPIAARRRPWGPPAEPLTSPGGQPESFQPPRRSGMREAALDESFGSFQPSFEELFDRLWSNFESFGRPKSERPESLVAEVVITGEEAREGGQVSVWIPGRATCDACAGRGGIGPYECWRCEGEGAVTTRYPVDVEYPGGIRDGYSISVPLTSLGIDNFYLTVLFRVSDDWE